MSRALTLLITFVCASLTALWASACPGGPGAGCPCFMCETAVSLTVVDADDNGAINNFAVEAIVNGTAEGTPPACQEDQRTGNGCDFGFDTGIYDLIVTAPGYQTREARVRQQERGNLCCDNQCLSVRELTVKLDPL